MEHQVQGGLGGVRDEGVSRGGRACGGKIQKAERMIRLGWMWQMWQAKVLRKNKKQGQWFLFDTQWWTGSYFVQKTFAGFPSYVLRMSSFNSVISIFLMDIYWHGTCTLCKCVCIQLILFLKKKKLHSATPLYDQRVSVDRKNPTQRDIGSCFPS